MTKLEVTANILVALINNQKPDDKFSITEQSKIVAASFLEIYDAVNQASATADYALIAPDKIAAN